MTELSSDERPFDGWTAGDHWQQAMDQTERANEQEDPTKAALGIALANVHLAAARLLLDHPPIDGMSSRPGDWRTQA